MVYKKRPLKIVFNLFLFIEHISGNVDNRIINDPPNEYSNFACIYIPMFHL
jgi:hypothetical protein